MKIFKFDLMTVLFIVVFIGVVATMSTQAKDYAVMEAGVTTITATTTVDTTLNSVISH